METTCPSSPKAIPQYKRTTLTSCCTVSSHPLPGLNGLVLWSQPQSGSIQRKSHAKRSRRGRWLNVRQTGIEQKARFRCTIKSWRFELSPAAYVRHTNELFCATAATFISQRRLHYDKDSSYRTPGPWFEIKRPPLLPSRMTYFSWKAMPTLQERGVIDTRD